MKPNIEEQINRAFESVKNTEPVELPFDFNDKVIDKLHAKHTSIRSIYSLPALLKVAAVFILVLINIFTLRLAFSSQPVQGPVQYVSINDFVNGYQINDTNEELVTLNTPAHE